MQIVRTALHQAHLLMEALSSLHQTEPADLAAAELFLKDPACLSWLAIEDNAVVGSLYGYVLRRPESPRPKYFLYELDVLPSHFRKGIGRALVSAFVSEAKSQNAQGAWVQAKSLDADARAF